VLPPHLARVTVQRSTSIQGEMQEHVDLVADSCRSQRLNWASGAQKARRGWCQDIEVVSFCFLDLVKGGGAPGNRDSKTLGK
jgi:hypothetical protein